MKYFLDTEFLEGTQKQTILGINIGKLKPTIDLISIGIISEDDREYYAISKDFNLKEAWNRYQEETPEIQGRPQRVYWIRENVLKPIFDEFYIDAFDCNMPPFTYGAMKALLNRCGKSNKQIAIEIKEFAHFWNDLDSLKVQTIKRPINIEFYAYYADYDWVVFCWLFGNMISLPKGFTMYCKDLKQILDEKEVQYNKTISNKLLFNPDNILLKRHIDYPKQINEHNSLKDAQWNFKLYKFLQNLKV